MKIIEAKERTPILIDRLLEVWEDSVKATHIFLSTREISDIKEYVPQALKEVEHLIIIENKDNIIASFMGINDKKLEMLFVKNSKRNKGIGKILLNHGIEKYGVNKVMVNEQNINALVFYEHMGFKVYKKLERVIKS